MDISINPKLLSGKITVPASKSQAHRAIIASELAGAGKVSNLAFSKDIEATLNCMKALKNAKKGDMPLLECNESGSTLRFLIPIALALCGGAVFTGGGLLMQRPQKPYFDIFDEKNISYKAYDNKLEVKGELTSGKYSLAGNVSSQFITGLLYALPLIDGDSVIKVTSTLESKGYVDMTIDVLDKFAVTIEEDEDLYKIKGNQSYKAIDMMVEGDYSQSAFWFVAKHLGSELSVNGLNDKSLQGDKCIIDYCEKLSKNGEVVLDVSQCPDLVPALALFAALRDGQITRLTNAARLRIKESDRLQTVTCELNKLGANIEELEDELVINGVKNLNGGIVDGHNDHRIAMMLAIAATRASGDVTIKGAQCVEKSYPNFWEEYKNLGGDFFICQN